jgi:glycosyltransferase involved in cell wall biosynthesis
MTILLVSHTSALDGAERSLAALARYLQRHHFNLSVMCPGPGSLPTWLDSHQIPLVYYKLPRPQRKVKHLLAFLFLWPLVVLRLSWWLRQNQVSMVYNNTIDGLYAPFAAKLAGVPCVWHVREVKPQRGGWRRPFTWMLRYLPQHTLFNSQDTMKAYAPQTIPRHWQVIYNGVEIPNKIPSRPPAKTVVVGFAGQFVSHKRPEFFLHIVAQAKEKVPSLQAIMVGEGHLLPEVKKLASSLKLADSVQIKGYIDDMASFYRQIDIFVLTSEQEPFGRVVAEAMAMGCPIIASCVGGVPEVVTEDCGFLVDPEDMNAFADKVVLLAKDEALRHRLGSMGQARVRQFFSEEENCQKIMALLVNG